MPGIGVTAAQRSSRDGSEALRFDTRQFCSWMWSCPGGMRAGGQPQQSCPKGNRFLRGCCASGQSAVKVKGSRFEMQFRRLMPAGVCESDLGCSAALGGHLEDPARRSGVRRARRSPDTGSRQTPPPKTDTTDQKTRLHRRDQPRKTRCLRELIFEGAGLPGAHFDPRERVFQARILTEHPRAASPRK